MKKRLAAIFIYADGCSLRLDQLLGDPPPRQVVLRTEAQFKKGIVRFRLRAVPFSGVRRSRRNGLTRRSPRAVATPNMRSPMSC